MINQYRSQLVTKHVMMVGSVVKLVVSIFSGIIPKNSLNASSQSPPCLGIGAELQKEAPGVLNFRCECAVLIEEFVFGAEFFEKTRS